MIIKNNHVVMTNQIALLLEFARLDQCQNEVNKELLDIDSRPDEERQKFYDEKETYFRSKLNIVEKYNWYWVYEKDPNAKTPKYGDQWGDNEKKEDDPDIDKEAVEKLKHKIVRVQSFLEKLKNAQKNGWKL